MQQKVNRRSSVEEMVSYLRPPSGVMRDLLPLWDPLEYPNTFPVVKNKPSVLCFSLTSADSQRSDLLLGFHLRKKLRPFVWVVMQRPQLSGVSNCVTLFGFGRISVWRSLTSSEGAVNSTSKLAVKVRTSAGTERPCAEHSRNSAVWRFFQYGDRPNFH